MELPQWRRVVVKLGTQVVVDDSGRFAADRIANILADLLEGAKERILVTSGAVGLGRARLLKNRTQSLVQKQACAAVGQSLLMNEYHRLLQRHEVCAAQMLVTSDDLTDRQKYLNFSETLNELLRMKALPILNENDSISTAELQVGKSFGDNDKLSAIVAAKMGADLLVILSNVSGFYKTNPRTDQRAERLGIVDDWSILNEIEIGEVSRGGRGGIDTKIQAAKIAAMNGAYTIVADGFQAGILKQILSMREWRNDAPFSLVLPRFKLPARKAWIGFSANTAGSIVINDGAAAAILNRGASLLPVGIIRLDGRFTANSIVSVTTENGEEMGRGLAAVSSDELGRMIKSAQAKTGDPVSHKVNSKLVAIHKDNLVIYREIRRQNSENEKNKHE